MPGTISATEGGMQFMWTLGILTVATLLASNGPDFKSANLEECPSQSLIDSGLAEDPRQAIVILKTNFPDRFCLNINLTPMELQNLPNYELSPIGNIQGTRGGNTAHKSRGEIRIESNGQRLFPLPTTPNQHFQFWGHSTNPKCNLDFFVYDSKGKRISKNEKKSSHFSIGLKAQAQAPKVQVKIKNRSATTCFFRYIHR
jgi:hypothetical protein